MADIKVISNSTKDEINNRKHLIELLKNTPIPDDELHQNMGLYINRQNLSRIFFMNMIYKKIINRHGIIIEFGIRWGQNLALFSNFRGMYEPYNYNRKIIGFDTFKGFPKIDKKDGNKVKKNDYNVTKDYELYLNKLLSYHQRESPLSHLAKIELIKGDVTKTIHKYLNDNPHTIIALAYFDFDIYAPTKECLDTILPYCSRGTVLAFDELNCEDFPGETIALKDVLDINKYKINRNPLNPLCSFIEL
jgi:hypothetical protein